MGYGYMEFTIPTTRVEIEIEGMPPCKCGSKFTILKHTHKRKKTHEGVTANCVNVKCYNNYNGILAYTEEDLLDKIKSHFS